MNLHSANPSSIMDDVMKKFEFVKSELILYTLGLKE